MSKIFHDLQKIGDSLESKGFKRSARVVTDTMASMLEIKTAQYEGGQGYAIRNRRCWDNCYRQKRVSSPERAAQEVWTDCWDEYLESINNNNSGWEKYAESQKHTKDAQLDKEFNVEVRKKVESGTSIPNAVYGTIEEFKTRESEIAIENLNKLMKIAESLEKEGDKELGQKVYDTCYDMIKEAGPLQWLDERIGPTAWNRAKGVDMYAGIVAQLKELINGANELLRLRRSTKASQFEMLLKEAAPGQTPPFIDPALQEKLRQNIANPVQPQQRTAQLDPVNPDPNYPPQSAPTAPQQPQQPSSRGALVAFRDKLNSERMELAQLANQAEQAGHSQVVPLVQGALGYLGQFDTAINTAINTYNQPSATPDQKNAARDQAYSVLSTMRDALINLVAGIQQQPTGDDLSQGGDADQDGVDDVTDVDDSPPDGVVDAGQQPISPEAQQQLEGIVAILQNYLASAPANQRRRLNTGEINSIIQSLQNMINPQPAQQTIVP